MNKFFSNRFSFIVFISVCILGIFFRFYQLGINPPSLDWDEASLGYNAYSILKTGADEYGNKFPLNIRSFDDYKPPLYVYLTVPSIAIFGLNEFSVRLPSAVLGILAVILTYFLVKELFIARKDNEIIALTSAFFMGISPWHLQFSKAAFEGNIGLTFFILGLFFFLKGLKHKWFLVFSAISYVLSMYSYHSFRLLVPIIIIASIIIFYHDLWQKRILAIIALFFVILFSAPIFYSVWSLSGSGARLSMVTIFSKDSYLQTSIKRLELDKKNGDLLGEVLDNRRVVYFFSLVKGYLDHFNPDFLFLHGDGGKQHHAVDMGMLYLFELPFIVIGFIWMVQKLNKTILFFLLYFFLSPIASAISTGTPHPVRAIAMIPALHIFTAFGIVTSYSWIQKRKSILKLSFISIALLLLIFNILYYLHQYYVHTPIEYGYFWQYGNKEAVDFAIRSENKYDKIIMTYAYDQPYIYYLFYGKVDPSWYQKNWDYNKNGKIDRFKRIIGKYEFRPIQFDSDIRLAKVLLIGTPEEIPSGKVVKEIFFPDGRLAYKITSSL